MIKTGWMIEGMSEREQAAYSGLSHGAIQNARKPVKLSGINAPPHT